MLRKCNSEHFVGSPICSTISTGNSAWQFSTSKEKKNRNSSDCFEIYKDGRKMDFIIIKKNLSSPVTHWPLKSNALLYLWDGTLINFNAWSRKVRVSKYQTKHCQCGSDTHSSAQNQKFSSAKYVTKKHFLLFIDLCCMVSLNIQEKRELCSLPWIFNLWHFSFLLLYLVSHSPMSNKIQLMERSSITALSHQTLTEPKLIFTDT